MTLEIFNWPKSLKKEKIIQESITKIFSEYIISTVNIVFVKNKKIKELNRTFRQKDYVTDVLSFNIDSKDILGEIYIAPEYVLDTIGEKHFSEEIIRLIIHGLLHLIGYDHIQKDRKQEMFKKQEEILGSVLRDVK